MWSTLALSAIGQLPAILQFVEKLVPGIKKGGEKRLAAASELAKYEGPLALDQQVRESKLALIDAQIAYLNAVDAAAEEAQRLGIVVPGVASGPGPAPQAEPPRAPGVPPAGRALATPSF